MRGKLTILIIILCIYWVNGVIADRDYQPYQIPKIFDMSTTPLPGKTMQSLSKTMQIEDKLSNFEIIKAYVTAYNTFSNQTDNTPCISADNTNICGRSDIVACPRKYPFGTKVNILGRDYVCHDRTALRFDSRFDISFDKRIKEAREFGKQKVEVKIYE